MFQIEIKVKLPFLWGNVAFEKNNWSQVNLIVGANGSGKTLLAEEIANQLEKKNVHVSFLRADRKESDEFYETLKENKNIREKIETILSNMFGKSIRFEKRFGSDGKSETLVPIVINKVRATEYNLKQGECHGLKEIITLLISLYSINEGCLILDEPELHLHPQFQQFFMSEIRKIAKLKPKCIFFLITHSPYFIDLSTAEDLVGVVACHVNSVPTSINKLTDADKNLFSRFLPRFNTYHKQFFFSDNQIFVEGYTDQQMFFHLLNCIDDGQNSTGTGIIDVGGKDELGVFFKVCALLGTNSRIITDLDSLFCGKLRDEVCKDKRVFRFLDKQFENCLPLYRQIFTKKELQRHKNRMPITLEKLILRLEKFLVEIGQHVYKTDYSKIGASPEIKLFSEKVKALYEKYEKPENLDTFKTVVLLGATQLQNKLKNTLPLPLAQNLLQIQNLIDLILKAMEAARVYVLSKGCIEHYYKETASFYMPISGKDKLFHAELKHLRESSNEKLKCDYKDLVLILKKACDKEK